MKIWKNLFGNGDKISGDEIIIGNNRSLGHIYPMPNVETVSRVTVSSLQELMNAINDIYNDIPFNSMFLFAVRFSVSVPPLGGNQRLIEGYKVSDNYGWVRATAYSSVGIIVSYCSKMAGSWGDWVDK